MSSTTSLQEINGSVHTLAGERAQPPQVNRTVATTPVKALTLGHDPIYEFVKRSMDILGALFIGVVFLLALPFLAIIIWLDSHGPIFYRQTRVGKDEAHFTIWKLRTMRTDAEKHGAVWASQNDDRVTRIGSLMRKTRIDELPQMWNVLRGDMSLVGPRPERPEFVSLLETEIPEYHLRHLVKPGVTGWAQVCYRYTDSVDGAQKKLAFDRYYVANRSASLDLSILCKTIIVVFRRNGW